jgi:hypothetical protein
MFSVFALSVVERNRLMAETPIAQCKVVWCTEAAQFLLRDNCAQHEKRAAERSGGYSSIPTRIRPTTVPGFCDIRMRCADYGQYWPVRGGSVTVQETRAFLTICSRSHRHDPPELAVLVVPQCRTSPDARRSTTAADVDHESRAFFIFARSACRANRSVQETGVAQPPLVQRMKAAYTQLRNNFA